MNLILQSLSFGLTCTRLFSFLWNLKFLAIILNIATYRKVNSTALKFDWICLIEKYVIISDCQSVEISFGTRTMFMDM